MTSMPPKRRDEILQFVILHIAVAALVEVGKTRLSRLLQGPQFGRFACLALFDQTQAPREAPRWHSG